MTDIKSWVEQHFTVERWRGAEADVRCRLHDDHHASASINVEKRVWRCRACDAGGKLSELAERLELHDLPPCSGNGSGGRREIARYEYRNAAGQLLYEVVRFEPKGFAQFNPASGQWSIKGVARVPYRLPELLRGIKAEQVIWIAEGEKDVDNLVRLGLVATCNQGGTGSGRLWREFFCKYFTTGTRVILCSDADEPGHALMNKIGDQLTAAGCSVKVMDLGYPIEPKHGKDVSDWLAEGHTREELLQLAREAAAFTANQVPPTAPEKEDRRPKQADVAVSLGDACDLFHDGDEAFARMRLDGHREVWPLRGREFRTWLRRQFYLQTETALGSAAMEDALGVLEGKALFEGSEIKTAVRIAGDDTTVYLDLANPAWQAVEITASGWRILDDAPVCFRRPPGLAALPSPRQGGLLDIQLEPFLNMGADDKKLFIACLVNALRPRGPYPVLCLHGEQGSAKSTAARVFRACVDPNTAMLRSAPREERDLVVAAHNSWVIAYDNLSHLPNWVSDALCRIATGSGFGARALYTNSEECLFEAQRPVVLNGIEELATRGDLLDRSVIVYLPAIEEQHRLTERSFNRQFQEVLPDILGSLLHAVSAAIRNLGMGQLDAVPRMADFCEWVMAAESGLGWEQGTFLEVYRRNRVEANTIVLDSNAVVPAVMKLLERGPWQGTATDLQEDLTELVSEAKRRSPSWPKSGRMVSAILKRLAPNLREVGVLVEWLRSNRERTIRLKMKSSVTTSSCVTASPAGAESGDGVTVGDDVTQDFAFSPKGGD